MKNGKCDHSENPILAIVHLHSLIIYRLTSSISYTLSRLLIELYVSLSVYCPSACLSVRLSVWLCICLCVCLPFRLCVCLFISLFVCLSIYLSVCASVCLSIYVSTFMCDSGVRHSSSRSLRLPISFSTFSSLSCSLLLSILPFLTVILSLCCTLSDCDTFSLLYPF